MGTLRDPPKPPEEGLLKPPGRPTLGRDAPKLGRPTLPRRDAAELGRPTLGRPALVLRTLLARVGPLLGLPDTPLEGEVDAGRRALLARAGFTRGWLTTVPVGRNLGTVLVTEGPAPGRPTTRVWPAVRVTVPVRVGVAPTRPTVPVRPPV